MLRPLLSAALAAAAISAYAQDLSQPVTVSVRASTLDRAIEQISAAAKVPMDINPTLAKEVVVVDVKGMPLRMLMDHLAEVVSGEWVTSGGQLRLTANSSKRRQEERAEIEAIARAIKADIDATLAPPKAQGGDTARALPAAGGSRKAVAQILAGVDPMRLATVERGTRLVFSTLPNAMQLPMPASATRALAEYVRAHNEGLKDQPTSPMMDSPEIPQFVRDMMARQTKPIGEVAKANLVISRQPLVQTTSAKLVLYGAKGETLHTADEMLGIGGLGQMFAGLDDEPSDQPAPTTQTPVVYSEDSKAFAAAFPTFSMSAGMSYDVKMSPELRRKVFTPEQYDPLSFGVTDEVMAVAKAANKGLVALLPDQSESFLVAMMGGNQSRTVEQVAERIKAGDWLTRVETPEAILLKPAKPAAARMARVDRVDLGRLMRTADAKGVPSLDDVVAYAKGNPEPQESGIITQYFIHLVPGVQTLGFQGETSWDALRLFAGINPLALNNLRSGQALSLRAMPQGPMQEMLFGHDVQLTVGTPTDDLFGMSRFLNADVDYRSEPTEAMPNGIPAQGTVTMKYSEESFAMPVAGSGSTSAQLGVLGSMELAALQYFRTDPQFAQFATMMPKLDRFRVGTRKVYEFTFTVAPGVTLSTKLMDHQIDRNSAAIAANAFPPAFQKQIDENVEKIKKSPLAQMGGMMGGMGGGRIRP